MKMGVQRVTAWLFAIASLTTAKPISPSSTTSPKQQVPQAVQAACRAINSNIPGLLHMPSSREYEKEQSNYWNIALRDIRPACIAMPKTAEDVSTIVKLLNQNPGVPFAIKSGGHAPSAGLASIDNGVLIALRNMAGTVYDANTEFAEIKPGGAWSATINELEKFGRTVPGGRLGTIGVGGYLSQSGLSYISAKRGLACDNIVEWETVLANGTIANIKASEQPELATALRGGGNQFGIHTKFTMRTFKQSDVWVGFKLFGYGSRDAVWDALSDFVENNHKNQDAAILFGSGFGSSNILSAGMMLIWTGGGTPPKGAFGKFEDLPTWLSFGTAMKYSTLHALTNPFINNIPFRANFRTFSLPHRYDDHSFYRRMDDVNTKVGQKHLANKWTMFNVMVFQPFPKSMGAASESRGGNAMGLSGNDPDRVVLEIVHVWARKADDKLAEEMAHDLTASLGQAVSDERKRIQAVGTSNGTSTAAAAFGEYNPLYMNDAEADQDVYGSWKNWRQFAKLQRELDPNRLWADRAGGYKFANVKT